MLFNHTIIELFEKVGQLFFCYSLLVAPGDFLAENLVAQKMSTNANAIYLCRILGCLVCSITALTFVARSNRVLDSTFDLISAVAWGSVAYVDFQAQALQKPEAFKMNMGLEVGLCCAFLYQYASRAGGGKSKRG